MQPNGEFSRALERVLPVRRGRYISYSDIDDKLETFELDGFRFQPGQLFGEERADAGSR
jgi:hypothetical protein